MPSLRGVIDRRILVNFRTDALHESSVFDSGEAASEYHRRGATGYSPSPDGRRFEGIEQDTYEWSVTPLSVESVAAS